MENESNQQRVKKFSDNYNKSSMIYVSELLTYPGILVIKLVFNYTGVE